MTLTRTILLPKEFSGRRGVAGQTLEESKIGDFPSRKVGPRRGPFHGDCEQDTDCSALRSVIHLPIMNCGNPESRLFSDLALQGTLKRFVSFDLSPWQGPKLLAGRLLNQQDVAFVVLNPCHYRDLLLWIKCGPFLIRHS